MNTNEYLTIDVLPQEKAEKFAKLLTFAIKSYVENKDKYTADEWLNGYLASQLKDRNTSEISEIASNIMNAIVLHDNTINSMKFAMESGKSAELWFQAETINSNDNFGKEAYYITESNMALTNASNIYTDNFNNCEVIDVEEIPSAEWNNDNWNSYKIKALVYDTIKQSGELALKVAANDLYEKSIEYGFQNILTDKEIINESVINRATTGLKVAVSGVLEVANDCNILPDSETDTFSRSMIACMSVENLKTFTGITVGKIDIVHGLGEITNTSIATLATIIKSTVINIGANVGKKVGTTIGTVFGPVGVVVGNFVGGAIGKMAGTTVGSKISETVKKIGVVAKNAVTKLANSAKNFGNKVKNGIKKLFSW